MLRHLKYLLIGVVCAGLVVLLLPSRLYAGAPECSETENAAAAITQHAVPSAYRAYMRLPEHVGGEAIVEAKSELTGQCFYLRAAESVAEGWYIANWANGATPDAKFLSSSLIWNNTGDVDAGDVLFVAADTRCSPNKAGQCVLNRQRQTTVYAPKLIGQDGDTIKVMLLESQSTKQIQLVIVYIDHKEAYRRKSLEPLDMRYMRAGDHEVETHVFNTDGSKVIYRESVNNASEDISTYYYVYIAPHLGAIRLVLAVFMAVVVSLGFLGMIRAWYRRHLWLKEHNLLR